MCRCAVRELEPLTGVKETKIALAVRQRFPGEIHQDARLFIAGADRQNFPASVKCRAARCDGLRRKIGRKPCLG